MLEITDKKSTANNVLVFPNSNGIVKNIDNLDKISDSITDIQIAKIEEIVGFVTSSVLENIHMAGLVPSQTEDTGKVLAFTIESMRALIYKYFDLDHDFHRLADEEIVISADKVAMYDERPVLIFQNEFINDEDYE